MRALVAVAVLTCACGARDRDPAGTAGPPVPSDAAGPPAVDFRRVMIPMRDGVKLETAILSRHRPGDRPRSFLLERTPYGIPTEAATVGAGASPMFAEDDRVMVFQNLRGRFGSEGTFVMLRPPHDPADPKGVDEATDAADTITWLLREIPGNSGRVCMRGTSYDAWTAVMATTAPHPALKCIVEAASPADMWIGDDFHHNGAFRLSYGFEYAALLETAKDATTSFAFDLADTYEWYLRLGALAHADERYLHGKIPTWENFVQHPDRDVFWQRQALSTYLHGTTVPTLNIAGWWDQEDFWGPFEIYRALERDDPHGRNFLAVGPWNHAGWYDTGRTLGQLDFGSATAATLVDRVWRPFVKHWLDDAPLDLPEASIFETGANQWHSYASWPPAGGAPRALYLRADGGLSFDAPTDAGDPSDAYVSDPADPVPYRPRPISPTYPGPAWPVWLVQDQRFVEHRPDVRTYRTEVLDQDVAIAGDIVVELWASTSGTDSDWVVKLIDVLPDGADPAATDAGLDAAGPPPADAAVDANPTDIDAGAPADLRGFELMVADEILRARYRDDPAHPTAVPAGAPVAYHLDLHSRAHRFGKGHRIMVQIQSSWFPLYDRNPQQFVPNIFLARDADFVAATQRIYRSPAHASRVLLPIAPAP
jgi:hypothetical protein